MNSTEKTTIKAARLTALLAAAGAIAAIIALVALDGLDSSTGAKVRATLLALTFIVLGWTFIAGRSELQGILMMGAVGASIGFAAAGLFGVGLPAFIPLVVALAIFSINIGQLDSRSVTVGTALSITLLILMLPVLI